MKSASEARETCGAKTQVVALSEGMLRWYASPKSKISTLHILDTSTKITHMAHMLHCYKDPNEVRGHLHISPTTCWLLPFCARNVKKPMLLPRIFTKSAQKLPNSPERNTTSCSHHPCLAKNSQEGQSDSPSFPSHPFRSVPVLRVSEPSSRPCRHQRHLGLALAVG